MNKRIMNEPYYCKECKHNHTRGQIYQDHIQYKDSQQKITDEDKFFMKGKLGEELEVRTEKFSDKLRIYIYKDDTLTCATDVNSQNQIHKRNQVREYIEENCF